MDASDFEQQNQQIQQIREAVSHQITVAKWDGEKTQWGPWELNQKRSYLSYRLVNQHGAVIPNHYEIPLNRVSSVSGRDNDSIEDWALQLSEKDWTNEEEVLQLVEALSALYNAGVTGKND